MKVNGLMKIFSLLLVLVLLFSIATPAFATGENDDLALAAAGEAVVYFYQQGAQVYKMTVEQGYVITSADIAGVPIDDDREWKLKDGSSPVGYVVNDTTSIYALKKPHEHSYTEEITIPATCGAEGLKTFICSCTDSYTQVIPATGAHSFSETIAPASCTGNGLKTRTCTACGHVETEDIPAFGHSYTSQVTKDPTCTDKGERTFTCGTCGDVYTEDIDAAGHVDNWTETTAATCGADGLKTNNCDVCGVELDTAVIPATGLHTYVGQVTKDPTCTDKGEETFTCSVCGDSYIDPVDATGHTDSWSETTAATCGADGLRTNICPDCGVVLDTAVIPATGVHQYVESIVSAPTCTDKGQNAFTCEVCGDSYTVETNATGHVDNWTVIAEATCDRNGLKSNICKECGTQLGDQVIPATGAHTEVVDPGLAPTCVTAGYTEGKHCSECGTVLVTQDPIAATGIHSYDSGVVTTDPTCVNKGVKTFTCTNCPDSYTEDVDATGLHTEQTVPAVDPTCTDTGLTEGKICSVCGSTLVPQTTVSANGHSYDSVVTAPTCTDDGYTTHICSVCGDSYKDTYVNKIGTNHKYSGTRDVAPTCTDQGYTARVCSLCQHLEKIDGTEIAALGHTEVTDAAQTPTCVDDGLTEGKHCSVCNTVLVAQQVDPAYGHSYTTTVTAPTCVDRGYTTYNCSECGDQKVDDWTNPTGTHTWDAGVVSTAATCIKNGAMTFTCTAANCGVTNTVSLQATGVHVDSDLNNYCDQCSVRVNTTGTSTNPKTADPGQIPLWIAVIVVGLVGMAGAVVARKQKRY